MICSTTNEIPGKKIKEIVDVVYGDNINPACAMSEMIRHGEGLSADGIIKIRFIEHRNNMMVYGTAVKLEDII